MKVLTIICLVGMYILGISDGDMTAAVVLTLLFMPVLFEGKKVRRCRKN